MALFGKQKKDKKNKLENVSLSEEETTAPVKESPADTNYVRDLYEDLKNNADNTLAKDARAYAVVFNDEFEKFKQGQTFVDENAAIASFLGQESGNVVINSDGKLVSRHNQEFGPKMHFADLYSDLQNSPESTFSKNVRAYAEVLKTDFEKFKQGKSFPSEDIAVVSFYAHDLGLVRDENGLLVDKPNKEYFAPRLQAATFYVTMNENPADKAVQNAKLYAELFKDDFEKFKKERIFSNDNAAIAAFFMHESKFEKATFPEKFKQVLQYRQMHEPKQPTPTTNEQKQSIANVRENLIGSDDLTEQLRAEALAPNSKSQFVANQSNVADDVNVVNSADNSTSSTDSGNAGNSSAENDVVGGSDAAGGNDAPQSSTDEADTSSEEGGDPASDGDNPPDSTGESGDDNASNSPEGSDDIPQGEPSAVEVYERNRRESGDNGNNGESGNNERGNDGGNNGENGNNDSGNNDGGNGGNDDNHDTNDVINDAADDDTPIANDENEDSSAGDEHTGDEHADDVHTDRKHLGNEQGLNLETNPDINRLRGYIPEGIDNESLEKHNKLQAASKKIAKKKVKPNLKIKATDPFPTMTFLGVAMIATMVCTLAPFSMLIGVVSIGILAVAAVMYIHPIIQIKKLININRAWRKERNLIKSKIKELQSWKALTESKNKKIREEFKSLDKALDKEIKRLRKSLESEKLQRRERAREDLKRGFQEQLTALQNKGKDISATETRKVKILQDAIKEADSDINKLKKEIVKSMKAEAKKEQQLEEKAKKAEEKARKKAQARQRAILERQAADVAISQRAREAANEYMKTADASQAEIANSKEIRDIQAKAAKAHKKAEQEQKKAEKAAAKAAKEAAKKAKESSDYKTLRSYTLSDTADPATQTPETARETSDDSRPAVTADRDGRSI